MGTSLAVDCSIVGCDRPKWARGWCGTHYQRWRTTGDVGGPALLAVKPAGRCTVPGCRKPVRVGIAGLCQSHYTRRMRHGSVDAGGSSARFGCRVMNCTRRHYSRGLCRPHWAIVVRVTDDRSKRLGVPIQGTCTVDALCARVAVFGGLCWMCRKPADEIDHVKPLAAGGPHWPSNLRPACHDCNARKQHRWPFDTSTRKAA